MFFALIEIVLVVSILWFIFTQVALPGVRGTALFPMFRRESKLKETLIEQHQSAREQALEREIASNQEVLTPSIKNEGSEEVNQKENV